MEEGQAVRLQQSQDLDQVTVVTDREQCQSMHPDASHGQHSGSSLDQNVKQNINTCVVALTDSPTAEANERDVSVELQGGSSIAYRQTTDANSTNILPPPYNSAMVGAPMPVSSAVPPFNMGAQSLPIQMGAQNFAYQHTEVVTAITVINPPPVQVIQRPVNDDVVSSEEESGFCFWCGLCLGVTWDCICCLCKCLCCIIVCLLSALAGDE